MQPLAEAPVRPGACLYVLYLQRDALAASLGGDALREVVVMINLSCQIDMISNGCVTVPLMSKAKQQIKP